MFYRVSHGLPGAGLERLVAAGEPRWAEAQIDRSVGRDEREGRHLTKLLWMGVERDAGGLALDSCDEGQMSMSIVTCPVSWSRAATPPMTMNSTR